MLIEVLVINPEKEIMVEYKVIFMPSLEVTKMKELGKNM